MRKLPDQKEVIIFTDLQRSTWTDSGSHAERGNEGKSERGNEVREALQASAKEASVVVIDLGQPRAANLAVAGLATTETFVTPGRDIAFDVTLHQFGAEPRAQCRVELLIDDVPVGEQTVDVPAGGDATVRINHRFQSAGRHAICIRARAIGWRSIIRGGWLFQSAKRSVCYAWPAAKVLRNTLLTP